MFVFVCKLRICVGGCVSPPTPRRLLECEMAERSLADTTPETDMNMETCIHIDTYPPRHSHTRRYEVVKYTIRPNVEADWSAQSPELNPNYQLWQELEHRL